MKMTACFGLVFALLTQGAHALAPREVTTQLPRNVRPTHYDIRIEPNAKDMNFSGEAQISIEVIDETSVITMNTLDLSIHSSRLQQGSTSITAVSTSQSKSDQTSSLHFDPPLKKGTYELTLKYDGKIGTQAAGLFALDYDTANGKQRALYTQFENSDARRVFPSWDEPSHKATFTLTVVAPSDRIVISNMPVAKATSSAGLTTTQFAQTPKMSTYLLFFAIGDFDRATLQAGKTEVGVVTQKGLRAQADFALLASQEVLREYNDYFGTPYPLPKLDNIAAPGTSQFFSAMENWGAIFTFERAMLLNPKISTPADKQEIFTVAAHEIAHQWFGDLVTMAWWDDIWLNEGFASWMEGRTTQRLHPEWNTHLSALNRRHGAMARDALATTHSVVQHVDTVEQASQAFDSITYQKGRAVISMLENYVGPEIWRAGVRDYIKQHAYGNAVTDDFWHAIETVAHKPVTAIAHDFTLQPGVPLIRVTNARCKGGMTELTLKQGEFSKDVPNKKPLRWRVPVIAKALGASRSESALIDGQGTLTAKGCEPVIVNAGQQGYYRTLYEPAHFQALAKQFDRLDSIDQLGMLGDTWEQGMLGLQSPADYLQLAEATPLDADPQVWSAIAQKLADLNQLYRVDPERQARYRRFAARLLSRKFNVVGWTPTQNESDTTTNLRNTLLRVLSDLNDATVIAEAKRRYDSAARDPTLVPSTMRRTISSIVAHHADTKTWDSLRAEAQRETTPMLKQQLYGLLGSNIDKQLAQRALDLALTSEPGATVSATIIARVAEQFPDLAFDFAVEKFSIVDPLVDPSAKTRFFAGLADGSSDPAMIEKIDQYAKAHLAPTSRRPADAAIATVRYRIKTQRERLPDIDAWLAKRKDISG